MGPLSQDDTVHVYYYMYVHLPRFPVAVVVCDVLRSTNRKKVQRIILATFRVNSLHTLDMDNIVTNVAVEFVGEAISSDGRELCC